MSKRKTTISISDLDDPECPAWKEYGCRLHFSSDTRGGGEYSGHSSAIREDEVDKYMREAKARAKGSDITIEDTRRKSRLTSWFD